MLVDILTIASLTLGALIFGYGFSASAVSHPAMMASRAETAVDYFKPFFHKSADTQLILSLILWAFTAAISFLSKDWRWFAAGTFLQISGPYTIFVLMPVNRRIMAEGADPHSEQMTKDLKSWGPIHFPRTVIAGLVFIYLAYLGVTA